MYTTVTVTIMIAVRRSISRPTGTCRSPEMTQVHRLPVKEAPSSTCRNTWIDSTAAPITPSEQIQCDSLSFRAQPNRPTVRAATSGSAGMASSSAVLSVI